MKDNPYVIYCPDCGKTCCFICQRYFETISDGWDNSAEDTRKLGQMRRAHMKHMATYDHKYVGDNDTSVYMGGVAGVSFRIS